MIAGVILLRARLTPLLSNNHQLAEPVNIPSTTDATDLKSLPPILAPSPVKIAANDKIGIGLLKVKKKVDE